MKDLRVDKATIWQQLAAITDPEIPIVSLVEMKVIRDVQVVNDGVKVVLAPTFVGCPALEQMKAEIRAKLSELGIENVIIESSFSPPWSTDMLDDGVKEKLRRFGIAPPPRNDGELAAVLALPVACPFCDSRNTALESEFGATLCKQIYYCNDCRQSFERFKPI
ncbi:MAG TPA: 1,2-phenylacetyl-CoA epoxidase subunit PaaD [Bacteroidota bacterium]|nr:1,2-phenylacetyl-CoA epoxidase subunit PaaD [Bacteroidota bacterium]